ncbi:tRNA lysidine(34) synthetase TilS [Azovibrio restrictus]|uniref:tRNA lysidine(34) synthetase TilS n=1 Tax=Azovibrio restrictus TaxID=146938 RepID=UPI0026EA74A9|nr:tRNA lysidine(34) synthetase TilS [Azovibrio restrictus]
MAASRNRLPADLFAGSAALLQAHLPAGAELWVGLSGGRDSVVLLHLCQRLWPRVRAIHVHHGLSPHADAWVDFCQALCRERQIPLSVVRVQVEDRAGRGLEAAAREARYRAYRESGAGYLALGHHRQDQVETLLFNLCRGTGVAGAAAMPACRRRDDLVLLRPLLAWAPADLDHYARARGLAWVEDESNRDVRYSRNYLRREILPRLAQHFPGVEASLARAAGHFAEAQELLDELARQDDVRIGARRELLLQLSPARQANWLRWWLRQAGWQVPDAAAATEWLRQLAEAGTEARVELPLPQGWVRLWQGGLYRVPRQEPPRSCVWDGRGVLDWGGAQLRLLPALGEGLSQARLAGRMLEVRLRQGGESLCPGPGRPRRPLKKLLQESGIPPWERQTLPLLYVEGELVACVGVALAAGWQCGVGEPGWLPTLAPGLNPGP